MEQFLVELGVGAAEEEFLCVFVWWFCDPVVPVYVEWCVG